MNPLRVIAADWQAPPGVQALFTTRMGGFSAAPWRALNLGDHVGDAPDAVAANRQRINEYLQLPHKPHWLKQVHGTAVADLDALPGSQRAVADASISSSEGKVCAVLTADCLPVLLAASDGSVVGAAHAGWRGLAAGVIEATVTAMRSRLAADVKLQAWMGPAIGPRHFEVGAEVRAAFLAVNASAESAFVRGDKDRWQCDLYAIARQRLATLKVLDVSGGQHCTYADAASFYSHRRDVQHQGQASTGRMAALIWRT